MKQQLEKNKYLEVKYFCRQYEAKKKRMDIKTAEGRRAKVDVLLMETTAKEVSDELGEYLLMSVSKGIAWEQLDCPCGRRQFYELRKEFYKKISERK